MKDARKPKKYSLEYYDFFECVKYISNKYNIPENVIRETTTIGSEANNGDFITASREFDEEVNYIDHLFFIEFGELGSSCVDVAFYIGW